MEAPITSADLAYSPTPNLQITRVLDMIEGQGSLKVLLADRFRPLRTHEIHDRIWTADLAHQSIEKNFKRGIAGDQHSVSSGSGDAILAAFGAAVLAVPAAGWGATGAVVVSAFAVTVIG